MSKDEYLITDEPLKALTIFAMPMILGSFFQQVYNMADSIIVGQFVGSSALAAVGKQGKVTYKLLNQVPITFKSNHEPITLNKEGEEYVQEI